MWNEAPNAVIIDILRSLIYISEAFNARNPNGQIDPRFVGC